MRAYPQVIGCDYEPVISTISLSVKWGFKPSKIWSGTETFRVMASLYRTTVICFSAVVQMKDQPLPAQPPRIKLTRTRKKIIHPIHPAPSTLLPFCQEPRER